MKFFLFLLLVFFGNDLVAVAQLRDKHSNVPSNIYLDFYGVPIPLTKRKQGVAILDNNVNESLKDISQLSLIDFSNGRHYLNKGDYDSAIFYFERNVERG